MPLGLPAGGSPPSSGGSGAMDDAGGSRGRSGRRKTRRKHPIKMVERRYEFWHILVAVAVGLLAVGATIMIASNAGK